MSAVGEAKVCMSCGRAMEWRKKWAENWDEIRYCSAACRRRRIRPIDTALETAIIDLLDRRAPGATICPSEAARAVDAEAWRELMEPSRRAARRLVHAGKVLIVQRGREIDAATARGPIRIRRSGR